MTSRFAAAHDVIPIDLAELPAPTQIELTPEPTNILDNFWKNSILRFFAPPEIFQSSETQNEPLVAAILEQPVSVSPNCPVDPLPLIRDAESRAFEDQAGVINFAGLTPTTVQAIERFQNIVRLVGGTVEITSGYRPSAYQDHLQAVWDKWMRELRRNRMRDCVALKAQVREEFSRHGLLMRQRPVLFSDHTMGIGFDASIALPRRARGSRRRLTIDRLAREAGISRPNIRRDPVHFRLIGGRVDSPAEILQASILH